MSDPAVGFSVSDAIGVITLNRPDNRNSMTPELLDAFASAAAQARSAPNERSYAMYESFLSLLDIAVPVIGALNGHAIGGGFGLALVCDLRIGARDAKYGANFVKLGLAPGMAISYLLPRLIGVARASELLLTGRLVDGAEAERLGILNRAVPAEAVLDEALAL